MNPLMQVAEFHAVRRVITVVLLGGSGLGAQWTFL